MNKPKLIILVEDEEEIRRSIVFTLKRSGFRVKDFATAEEAIEHIKSTQLKNELPDLLITDIRMAGMSGVELAEEIRTMKLTLQILVITGQASREQRNKLIELGVACILNKPFSLKELVDEVKNAIEGDKKWD